MGGKATSWYFLRYWVDGPHLRIRVRDADEVVVDALAAELRDAVRRLPGAAVQLSPEAYYPSFGEAAAGSGWVEHGSVVLAPYEPEVARYGGPEAIGFAEEFFVESALVARAVMDGASSPAARFSIALDLLFVAAEAVGWDPRTAVIQYRRYFFGWDFSAEVTPVASAPLLDRARTILATAPETWRNRRDIALIAADDSSPSLYSRWAESIGRYRRCVAEAVGSEQVDVDRIVWSQLHMFHNRLGISVSDERVLVWLASLCLLPAPEGDGLDRADRVYLEASKFTAPPGAGVASIRERPGSDLVRLPSFRSISTPFGTALDSRRSRRSGYAATLDVDQVSTVFGSTVSRRGDGRRTYPTPGGVGAISMMVDVVGVEGIADGSYRYLPDEHALQPSGTVVNRSDLQRASPYLALVETDSRIDLRAAQLVVILVADLSALEPTYGRQSLKLAWLEAGHASQALVMTASALGLGALPVTGFADDELNAGLHLDGVARFAAQLVVIGGIARP